MELLVGLSLSYVAPLVLEQGKALLGHIVHFAQQQELVKAIAGSLAYDGTKKGLELTKAGFLALLRERANGTGLPANHDVVRACRRATMLATNIAAGQFARDASERDAHWETRWGEALARWCFEESRLTYQTDHVPPAGILAKHATEIAALVDGEQSSHVLQELAINEVLAEIESWHLEVYCRNDLEHAHPPAAFAQYVRTGWPLPEPTRTRVQRVAALFGREPIEAQGGPPSTNISWFGAFAAQFGEELKTNSRVQAILSTTLLKDIQHSVRGIDALQLETARLHEVLPALLTKLGSDFGAHTEHFYAMVGQALASNSDVMLTQFARLRHTVERREHAERHAFEGIEARMENLREVIDRLLPQSDDLIQLTVTTSTDGLSRFTYQNARDEFVGRIHAADEMTAFLSPSAKPDFRWHVVLGPAGVGKSRFALELVRKANERRWYRRSGFINTNKIHSHPWHTWLPEGSLFLVIDDAGYRGMSGNGDQRTVTQRVLDTLAELHARGRLTACVRVLLLEREVNANMIESLAAGCAGREAVRASRHASAPAVLRPLERQNYLQIMRARYLGALDAAPSQVPTDEQLERALRSVDPDCRPLFAAIVGEELARNPKAWSHGFDSASSLAQRRRALFKEVIDFERGHWWKLAREMAASPAEAERMRDEHELLLVLTTIARGLEMRTLRRFEAESCEVELPGRRTFNARLYERMSGSPSSDGTLAALQPDLVGELYVEEVLAQRPRVARDIVALAWSLDATGSALFAALCELDYGTSNGNPVRYLPACERVGDDIKLRVAETLTWLSRVCAYRLIEDYPNTAPPWEVPPLDSTAERDSVRTQFAKAKETARRATAPALGEDSR